MNKGKKVLLVIVHFGEQKTTMDAVASVRGGDYLPDIAVICKKDEVATFSREGVLTIQDDENKGYSRRLNIAIDYAAENGYDYVILSNNDILVLKDTISGLLRYISVTPETIVGPLIIRGDGKVESAGIRINLLTGRHYHLYHNRRMEEINKDVILPDAVAGTFLMMETQRAKRIRFDEEFDYYFEDVAFCLKARELKVAIPVVLTDFRIIHRGALNIRKIGSQRIASMVTRNHLRVIKRFSLLRDSRLKILPLTHTILLNLLYFTLKTDDPFRATLGVISGAVRGLLWTRD